MKKKGTKIRTLMIWDMANNVDICSQTIKHKITLIRSVSNLYFFKKKEIHNALTGVPEPFLNLITYDDDIHDVEVGDYGSVVLI